MAAGLGPVPHYDTHKYKLKHIQRTLNSFKIKLSLKISNFSRCNI